MSHVGGNNMSRLGPTGLTQLLTNIKTWVTTKLGNYVTTDTTQTITGKKSFTNAAIQLDSLVSMSGSTMFINTSASVPRGAWPTDTHRVGRIYIGDGTSYNGAWFIVDPIIDTTHAVYRMVTTNPDNTDSTRFSIVWDSTKTGARCRKNVSQGDLLPSANNTYNLGADDLKWGSAYVTNLYINGTQFVPSEVMYLAGNETVTGTKIFNGDKIVITQGNGYRMVCNNDGGSSGYGVFQRVDSANWYFMVTAQDDALGTWTSARPITIRLSDGYCTINGKAVEANKVQATIDAGTTAALVQGTIASNDCFRIAAGGAANAGWAEIATGDDANEPIYVRQYKGSFTTLQRTATLLDGSGNTSFPGTVTATGFSGPVSGNASSATEFSANKSVTLTGDVTGTASSKAGWSVATTLSNSGVTAGTYGPSADVTGNNNATISVPEITVDSKGRVTSVTNRTLTCKNNTYNVYNKTLTIQKNGTNVATFTSNSNTNVTANITVPTKVSELTNDSGYLTAHQSLSNYVTTNTDQSISGIKSHSKHIAILGDYVGNESSTNGRSCLYLKANRDTDGKSGLYVTKFRQNVAQGSMGNSDFVFLSHDILENETRTNAGFVESYSNWANDVPGGVSIYSTIATRNLGTSAKPWTNAYAVNIYENGTALSSKYVQINSLAGGNAAGSLTHSIGSLVLARCSDIACNNIKLYCNVAGVQLYPCRTEIYTMYGASGTHFVPIVVRSTNDSNLGSGTWRYLGGASTDFNNSAGEIYGMFLRVA